MKKLLATVMLFASFFYLSAQKAPIKFGNIPMEDMAMTSYDKDSSAAAVVLADYGQTEFIYQGTQGWKLIFERITRIKIFNKSGYGSADFSIPLYHKGSDDETLSGLKAVTYNLENGKIVETKMKNDAVFVEKNTNWNYSKFTLPNVKEGSIVEVTYRVSSDFLFNFQDWQFQAFIPTRWSEYRANFPEFFHYEKFMQGYVSLAINESKQREETFKINYEVTEPGQAQERGSFDLKSQTIVNRWVAQDVPAFKEEPYLSSYKDYISNINFELDYIKYPNEPIKPVMGTWEQLNKAFLDDDKFGQPVNGSGYLKKPVEEVTTGLSTKQEKISAIYSYVKSNVAWDGRSRVYLDENFKKPLDEKKGSSAEINLMLVSMLQKADIDAYPVLISTRSNGFVRENMAIASQFNYVICIAKFDDKYILLDATDRMLPINILPERCINGRGYVISKTPHWVELKASKSKESASAEVVISADGQMKGKIQITHDGYFGHDMRTDYFKKGEEEYVKEFSQDLTWQLDKSEFENLKNPDAAAKEKYEFTLTENSGNGSVIYISPMLYGREAENPFKLANRTYPVDFGKTSDQTFFCRFTIPENFVAEEMPASKVFALPNNAGKYVYSLQIMGNVITLTSVLSINQPLFTPNDYPFLREFYNMVVAKQAEQIVLKKKN